MISSFSQTVVSVILRALVLRRVKLVIQNYAFLQSFFLMAAVVEEGLVKHDTIFKINPS